MRKLICLLIAILLLLGGCKSMNPADYTVPSSPSQPGQVSCVVPEPGEPPSPEYPTYEEYSAWIDKTYTGIDFIHYDDISFTGEYYSYAFDFANIYNEVSTYHTRQYFGIKDSSGKVRRIEIRPLPTDRDPSKYPKMPDVENYYRVLPVDVPYDTSHSAYHYAYRVGNIVYGYRSYEGDPGSLVSVTWEFGNKLIQVFSSGHEITEDSGFFYDLMDPKKAQSAVNRFNFAILMAYVGNCLTIWAPVIIPVLCVAAVGTVYLIIRRKRKKAAAGSTVQGGELKTEE